MSDITPAYFCSHDGYSPTNRGNWCDLGCGSDYNHIIGVPKRHVERMLNEARQNELYLAMREVESMGASEEQTRCISALGGRMRLLVAARGKSEVGKEWVQ